MADGEHAPDGAPEVVHDELPDIQDAPVTAEGLASELGWSPLDQWRGDPDEWRSAGDFLKDTVKVNKAERRARKNLEDRLGRLQRTTDTIVERTRAEERAKVLAEHKAAVDDGDDARALQIARKLDKIEHEASSEADPAVGDFVSRNPWFSTDPLAQQLAVQTAEVYAKQGKSPAEQMEAAEKEVRKRFPEHFEQPKRPTKGPAEVAEQQGRTARSTTSSREKGFADMPRESQAFCLKLEKQGVPRADIVREYWKENA